MKVLTSCCNAPLCLDRQNDYLCSKCGFYFGVEGAWSDKGSGYPGILILLSHVNAHVELTPNDAVVLVWFKKGEAPKDAVHWPTAKVRVVTEFDAVLTRGEAMARYDESESPNNLL